MESYYFILKSISGGKDWKVFQNPKKIAFCTFFGKIDKHFQNYLVIY